MKTKYLIPVDEFCANHHIEVSFISSLHQTGLIEISTIRKMRFIDATQLRLLEQFVNFYYELDINIEGIETITHLLKQIDDNQFEILQLNNRLRLYESE
jgi:chaperone modulatory protein CbpM